MARKDSVIERCPARCICPLLVRNIWRAQGFGGGSAVTEQPPEDNFAPRNTRPAVLGEEDEETAQAAREVRIWEQVFMHAGWGVAIVDPVDETLLRVNPAFARLHGQTVNEMIGRPLSSTFAVESRDCQQHVRAACEQGQRVYESIQRRADGTTFPALTNLTAVRDTAGNLLYLAVNLQDITERQKAEEQLRRSHEQLQSLTAHLHAVREEESARIAREIHDELGQLLTALLIDLSWLEDKHAAILDDDLRRQLAAKTKAMTALADRTIDAVRRIGRELRPEALDDFGLMAAIDSQVREFQQRTGVKCHLTSNLEDARLDPDWSTALFRILQEALTNIARHAGATRVDILLEERKDHLVLEVKDNGRGIRASEVSGLRSLGILGMRERARLLGGRVQIAGVHGRGTTVTVRVPRPLPMGTA
jgi:two-component system sensor histidine kinase UhpB